MTFELKVESWCLFVLLFPGFEMISFARQLAPWHDTVSPQNLK